MCSAARPHVRPAALASSPRAPSRNPNAAARALLLGGRRVPPRDRACAPRPSPPPPAPPRETLAPPREPSSSADDAFSPPPSAFPSPSTSFLRLARSEHRQMDLPPRMRPAATSPPSSALPAPNIVGWGRAHLPPPFLLHCTSLVSTRSGNCHIDHIAHASRFPRKTAHRRHHAQLPTITLTLFQPSPTTPTSATSYS
ncbi:hypothetical protein GUJ93_ZPchr0006g41594 [Zizania palustris]|uniref:Uncharacterized protein n=1 Tax=Zizania palustris TaxID=103762 RepID=A0A8J5VQT2_ZIZPA|nr:hypothetical protein GUJ93_ZPchr0006g41594 [Zizania palustris]